MGVGGGGWGGIQHSTETVRGKRWRGGCVQMGGGGGYSTETV